MIELYVLLCPQLCCHGDAAVFHERLKTKVTPATSLNSIVDFSIHLISLCGMTSQVFETPDLLYRHSSYIDVLEHLLSIYYLERSGSPG